MKPLTFMIGVISFVCVLFLPPASGEEVQENIYYAPLTNPNTAEKFTVEDQQYLYERAGALEWMIRVYMKKENL